MRGVSSPPTRSTESAAPVVPVGAEIDVQIEKPVYRGLGLARHAGQVVFVPRAFTGERVRVRVQARERGYLRGRLAEVLEPSAARRPSPCRYVPECGGCAYQELDYPAQVEAKLSVLREALARAGVAWEQDLACESGPEVGFRLRAGLHVDPGPPLRLGLHAGETRRVVDLERCLQLTDGLNAAARELHTALSLLPPRLARLVRGVELLETPDGSRRVAALESDGDVGQAVRLRRLASSTPSLHGLGVTAQERGRTRFLALDGEPHVDIPILGTTLRVHARSFFQSNRFLVEALARHVLDLLGPGDGPVLDLYAGVGLFALPLALRGIEVRAVELSPFAAEDARFSAERAGAHGLRVFRGDVRAALRAWPVDEGERVVLDPPRTGAGAEVVAAVAERRPERVVYVSCDPPTLGRDLGLFAARGYALEALRAFDLFPDTFHVEAVALLRPN
jgi:23S rRNA (uracil1939-C5)-methyltransferase